MDLPPVDIRPTADTAPAAEYADCNKDFPPSNSPAKFSGLPAARETVSFPSNRAASGPSGSRQNPSDKESSAHVLPECPVPIYRRPTGLGRGDSPPCQTPKAVRQSPA